MSSSETGWGVHPEFGEFGEMPQLSQRILPLGPEVEETVTV